MLILSRRSRPKCLVCPRYEICAHYFATRFGGVSDSNETHGLLPPARLPDEPQPDSIRRCRDLVTGFDDACLVRLRFHFQRPERTVARRAQTCGRDLDGCLDGVEHHTLRVKRQMPPPPPGRYRNQERQLQLDHTQELTCLGHLWPRRSPPKYLLNKSSASSDSG
jgi:hypothetical protein